MNADLPIDRVPMAGVSNFRDWAKAAALKQAKDASRNNPAVKSPVADLINQLSKKAFRHQIIRTPNPIVRKAKPISNLSRKKLAILKAMYKEKNQLLSQEELEKYNDLNLNDEKYDEMMQFVESMDKIAKIPLHPKTSDFEKNQIQRAQSLMRELDEASGIKTGALARRIDIICRSKPSETLTSHFVQIVSGEQMLPNHLTVSASEREKLNAEAKQQREDRIDAFVERERRIIHSDFVMRKISNQIAATKNPSIHKHDIALTMFSEASQKTNEASSAISEIDTKHKTAIDVHATASSKKTLQISPLITPKMLPEREKAFNARLFEFLQMHRTVKNPASFTNEVTELLVEAEACYACLQSLNNKAAYKPALDRFETQIAHLRLCLSKNNCQYLNALLPKYYGGTPTYFARIYSDHLLSENRKKEHLWQNITTKEYRFGETAPTGKDWKQLSAADLTHILMNTAKTIDTMKDPLLVQCFEKDLKTTIDRLPKKSDERTKLEKSLNEVTTFRNSRLVPRSDLETPKQIQMKNLFTFINYTEIMFGAAKEVPADEMNLYQGVEFAINKYTGEIKYSFELPKPLPKDWKNIPFYEIQKMVIDQAAKDKKFKQNLLAPLKKSSDAMIKGTVKDKFIEKIQELEKLIQHEEKKLLKNQPWMKLKEFLMQRSSYNPKATDTNNLEMGKFLKQIKAKDHREHFQEIWDDKTNTKPFDNDTKNKLNQMKHPQYVPNKKDLEFINVNILKATRALILVEAAMKASKALVTIADPHPEIHLKAKHEALLSTISILINVGNKINALPTLKDQNPLEVDDSEVGDAVNNALDIINKKGIEISRVSPEWTYDELEAVKDALFLIKEELNENELQLENAIDEKEAIALLATVKPRQAILKLYQETLMEIVGDAINYADYFAPGIFDNLLESHIAKLPVNQNEDPKFKEFQAKIKDDDFILSIHTEDLNLLIHLYAYLRNKKNAAPVEENQDDERRLMDDEQAQGQVSPENKSLRDISLDSRDPLYVLIIDRLAHTDEGMVAWKQMFEELHGLKKKSGVRSQNSE